MKLAEYALTVVAVMLGCAAVLLAVPGLCLGFIAITIGTIAEDIND
jgi:hypothetical protein